MKWSYWISLYIRTHCVARGFLGHVHWDAARQ